ncbi:MAG TPA: hypothetical protein VG713_16220, partial [Pirellulales bacterium]|nr:hypothetical protein [Pirellulales bacterium]
PAAAIVEIEPTAAKQPAPSAERKPPEPSERALAQPIEKRPVPATDAQTKAQELVKDIFRDELAGAKTTEAKEALIAKLLDQSTIGSGEPAECYAMISQARDLAIEAGDPTAAQRAIAKLDEWFAIDACEELTGALARMADKSLLPAPSYKALAELAIAESDHAVALEHWDAAKRLSDISLTAVRKSKDAALTRQAVDHSKSIAAGRAQWEAAQKALDTLERNPDDPAANLVVGRYRCFVQSDWAGGLKYLAASGDSHLQELAAKSIAVGNDPLTVAELGDAWWDAAERAKSKDKVELRQGAAHWYAAALEGLSGLARTRVEKRLAELSAPAANATVKKTPAPARPSPPSKNALAANGLTIPNVLDCSSQIFVFDPGPTFDSGKSWTLRFEFMAGSSEKLDRTLAWYGDQVGSVIAIKYRTDSVEARAGYGTSEQMMVSGPLTPTNQPKWVPLVFKFDAAANELVLFLNNEQVAKNHAIKTKADRPLRFYVGGRPDRPEQFPGLIRAVWFGN